MRALILTLIIVSNLVVGMKNQFNIIYDILNPADYVSQIKNKDLWFAYQVKALNNTTSMCCWEDSDSDNAQCNLDNNNASFGSSSSDGITENLNIYVNVKKGAINKILTLGDQCKVIVGKQEVNWLNDIAHEESIKWLKQISNNNSKKSADNALYSLAHHAGTQASVALFEIASLNNHNNSEQAVFWLGNSRNDGVTYLQKLYKDLPNGDVKRHINFALSQSMSPESLELLQHIAINDNDTEQRADAYFWLAQKSVPGIEKLLLNAIKNDKSHAVKEKAIFSLSQVKSEKAENALLDLVENHKNTDIQEKALFWLAQINPLKAKELVLNVLKSSKSEDQINNAVFTLSQISKQSNDDALFGLLSNDYSKQVKKQVLFWLSQSDNSKTIEKLESLL